MDLLIKEKKHKFKKIREVLKLLKKLQISSKDIIIHPEVISCHESKEYYDMSKYYDMNYGLCKNLFIRDKKGHNFWLVIIDYSKEIDFKSLRLLLDSSKLMLATDDDLRRILNVEPGSVSLFSIINDINKKTEVLIDETLLKKELLAFHPNYNGMTVFVESNKILDILEAMNVNYSLIDIVSQKFEDGKDIVYNITGERIKDEKSLQK